MQDSNREISGTKAGLRGRPRDPAIEARILDAALALYARQGWLGFNLDAVARDGGVSKDALYRRWKSRDALLQDALRTRWDWVATIDEGNVRSDLLELAARTFDTFAGTYGEVALQLRADARRFPEVNAFAEPYRELMVRQGRDIVRRAIANGELSRTINPGLLMDLLIGGITNHIVSTPRRLRAAMIDNRSAFIHTIVDAVMVGVAHVAGGH
ncbi:MAG: TetR/AcrR family transcriptional regulator [Sphingomonas sp.]